ncbi:MAG: hypothetical protein JOZ62_14965, partial [Acidobacteriaceae bacterium]|nr:hypothetical protein [Acidobacteriaceae bacterium]
MWESFRITAAGMLLALAAIGGSKEFGQAELERAIQETGAPDPALVTEIRPGSVPEEGYQISGNHLVASDERGLMYGLLEAAEEIRRAGRLADCHES